MALEGANIAGQAQVYNQTQKAVDVYAKTLAQQQAKRETEQKALADKLAKFSTQGLREIDKEGFYKVYDSWRAKSAESLATKDQREKFRLNSEAEKERIRAEQYVADSKAKTQRDSAVGTKILGKPYFFSEEGKKMYNKSLSAPIYSKDDISDYNSIPLGYDKSKVGQDLSKLNDVLLKTVAKYEDSVPVLKKAGDLTVAEFDKIKKVPQGEQVKAYELFYNTDDGFQALLEENYPNLDWDNNKGQALQTALVDFSAKYPLSKNEGVDRRTVPNLDISRRRLALAEANASGGGDGINAEIVVRPKNFIGKKLPLIYKSTGKPVFNEGGTTQKSGGSMVTSEFPVYSAVNPTAFAMSQVDSAFDIDKGVNRGLEAGTYKLTGIGYNIVKGGKTQLRATIMDEDNNEYVINPSNLPADIRGDKYYKKVIKAVEDEWAASNVQPKQKVKTETKSKFSQQQQELAIARGLKDNPGYTRAEIIEGLGL
jgi:hypothetical protein